MKTTTTVLLVLAAALAACASPSKDAPVYLDWSGSRGPMKLISPRTIFSSWGTSSRRDARSTRPTRVTLGSRCAANWAPFTSASLAIVRSFKRSNSRPLSPTRRWIRKIGPGESSLMSSASNGTGGGSDEICPSCSFQFGFSDDDRGWSYSDWRRKWVDEGMLWDKGSSDPPSGWDPIDQLRHAGLLM